MQASDHNQANQFDQAKGCGQAALFCNVFSVAYYVLLIVAAVVLLAIYLTVGLSVINNNTNVVYD